MHFPKEEHPQNITLSAKNEKNHCSSLWYTSQQKYQKKLINEREGNTPEAITRSGTGLSGDVIERRLRLQKLHLVRSGNTTEDGGEMHLMAIMT